MAKTVDRNATFIFRHESWDADEYWVIRSERGTEDDQRIQELTTQLIVDEVVTPEKVLELTLAKQNVEAWIEEHITPEQVMRTQYATMIGMTDRWTLRVDPELTRVKAQTPDGEDGYDEDGTLKKGAEFVLKDGEQVREPHPLAGEPMPLTAKWIGDLPPEVSRQAWSRMNAEWQKHVRTPDQQAAFPGERVRVVKDRKPRRSKEEVPVSA